MRSSKWIKHSKTVGGFISGICENRTKVNFLPQIDDLKSLLQLPIYHRKKTPPILDDRLRCPVAVEPWMVGSRLIADIQQRKANDIIRPPAAIRPLDANDGITAFSDIPAPTVFTDHQGDPASPNSSKNRLCRFLSTSDSLSNGAIVA